MLLLHVLVILSVALVESVFLKYPHMASRLWLQHFVHPVAPELPRNLVDVLGKISVSFDLQWFFISLLSNVDSSFTLMEHRLVRNLNFLRRALVDALEKILLRLFCVNTSGWQLECRFCVLIKLLRIEFFLRATI